LRWLLLHGHLQPSPARTRLSLHIPLSSIMDSERLRNLSYPELQRIAKVRARFSIVSDGGLGSRTRFLRTCCDRFMESKPIKRRRRL
ncbi:hypothetical protein L227DRAFT_577762, partial [Lentinus tigrinus ALCF2SS1-6]